jgi:hypothetical protein
MVMSYTLRQLSRVTRVTGRAANAVPCVICDSALFPMPFALGAVMPNGVSSAAALSVIGCLAMNMPCTGDEQENDRRHGDQLTDTKARTMLSLYSDLSEVGHPSTAALQPCLAVIGRYGP